MAHKEDLVLMGHEMEHSSSDLNEKRCFSLGIKELNCQIKAGDLGGQEDLNHLMHFGKLALDLSWTWVFI